MGLDLESTLVLVFTTDVDFMAGVFAGR
jgi:hypothetical protein